MQLNFKFFLVLMAAFAATSTPALAYMGPGIGLGAITTSLGILGAILLGLVSLLWYPLKRLIRRLRKEKPQKP